MYSNDLPVGGSDDDVLHDLNTIKEAESLNLTLNTFKRENNCRDDTVRGNLIVALPSAKIVSSEMACLLGSPLGGTSSIDASLEEKIKALKTIWVPILNIFSAHDALTFLHHYLSFPSSSTSSCGLCHVSCLDSWRSMITLCAPS